MASGGAIEARLAEAGLAIPEPPKPIGRFAYGVVAHGFLFVSGTYGTIRDEEGRDELPLRGKVGRDLTIEQGYQSARLVALNLLAMARAELGDLEGIERPVRLAGYVNAASGFDQAPAVLNGASDVLHIAFGPKRGRHARVALYQKDLARDAPLAAELMFALITR